MAGDRSSFRKKIVRKKIEMDDDKLIEMVRRNPSLYEVDHCKYGSGTSRAKTWKAIGAELKRHPIFCKKRWGNIRDNYKKAMKKYHWKHQQGYTTMKKYKYCDKLEFLGNQLDDNKDKESLSETLLEVKCEPDIDPDLNESSLFDNFNQEQYNENDDTLDQPKESVMAQFDSNHFEENQTEQFDNYSQADTRINEIQENEDEEKDEETEKLLTPKIETVTSTHFNHSTTSRTKRKLRDSDSEASNAAKSMRYIVERVEAEKYMERHPVDAFLSGIAPTLKSLSPYFLSLAKTQIYSIVQEYEMAMIMEKRQESHRV